VQIQLIQNPKQDEGLYFFFRHTIFTLSSDLKKLKPAYSYVLGPFKMFQ